MITLDTDLYLLCSLFNINRSKLSNEYSTMSVDEIMKAEAAQGNSAAANYSEIINNPDKLIELFQLEDPTNKHAILRNMNESDLENMLPFLTSEDLIVGLNYFTKDKLLKLMEQLPKEQLVNYVFQMFSKEQLMYMMPNEELNKVLTSPDMDKALEIKCLKNLKPEILIQMYEAATGKPISYVLNQDIQSSASGTQANNMPFDAAQKGLKPVTAEIGLSGGLKNIDVGNLINQIINLPDDKFQEAMLSIPKANKQGFVFQMSKENPEIFEMIDSSAYINILNQRKEKDDLIKCANVIGQDQLVGMIEELPQDLTAVILTQIDTRVFANILIANFKNILKEIAAG